MQQCIRIHTKPTGTKTNMRYSNVYVTIVALVWLAKDNSCSKPQDISGVGKKKMQFYKTNLKKMKIFSHCSHLLL